MAIAGYNPDEASKLMGTNESQIVKGKISSRIFKHTSFK